MMQKKVKISKKESDYISELLNMTGKEIYDKYGLKRDETITHTVDFGSGIQADIKLVICEEDSPYTEGVLFLNGYELTHTEPSDEYLGKWNFELSGNEYVVIVSAKEWGENTYEGWT